MTLPEATLPAATLPKATLPAATLPLATLIVGGGIAGAAAACLLGSRATLIERERGPHDKICGEFISWEAQDALRHLGVDPQALGGAPIHSVRLVHKASIAAAPLPRPGIGLSRRVLDAALLARAAERGATVLRGHTVRRLAPGGAEVDGIGHIEAARVLLATGKHELRGAKRAAEPGPLVGLKMYYSLAPDQAAVLAGHVEVVLFPGGYAGLQTVEGGRANLCLLIHRDVFEQAGAAWDGVVAHLRRHSPWLAQRLADAVALLARPVAIFRVPYGFVHRPGPADPAGVMRLGDQVGVIPSFSGDGMAIALHTAFAAAAARDAPAFHQRMRSDLAKQIGRAMLLHRLGQTVPGGLARVARTWPGALAHVARLTRVPGPRLAWQ